jgi:thiamine biosynthesis lipoprotein
MKRVRLNEAESTILFEKSGMMIDLGSMGKGYALESAAGTLGDCGIEHALLHGGTSTVYGLGIDPENGPWKVAIEKPPAEGNPTPGVLSVVRLQDCSLSVSAPGGKFFMLDGKRYGHVLDPRTGWPVAHAVFGAAKIRRATESDALSTAVLVSSGAELETLAARIPEMDYLRLHGEAQEGVLSRGFELEHPLPTGNQ